MASCDMAAGNDYRRLGRRVYFAELLYIDKKAAGALPDKKDGSLTEPAFSL